MLNRRLLASGEQQSAKMRPARDGNLRSGRGGLGRGAVAMQPSGSFFTPPHPSLFSPSPHQTLDKPRSSMMGHSTMCGGSWHRTSRKPCVYDIHNPPPRDPSCFLIEFDTFRWDCRNVFLCRTDGDPHPTPELFPWGYNLLDMIINIINECHVNF